MKPIAGLACLLLSLTAFASAAEPDPKPLFTILYTAEAHGALLPCDCPLQPLGGVARRATLINKYRARGPVLLLEGGGYEAGGLYDEDSDGDDLRDINRSSRMLDCMKLMSYDAISDNKGPPMIEGSWNGQKIYSTHRKNGISDNTSIGKMLGTQKVVINRRSDLLPQNLKDLPPLTTRTKDEFVICLSRLGEEESEKLAVTPGIDIVFNAGRKSSTRESWKVGSCSVVNFDFQARHLVVVEVFPAKNPEAARFDFKTRFEPLDKSIPDDPTITAILAPHLEALKKKGKKLIEIEYWTMPDCPGCKLARPDLDTIQTELNGRVKITPHWVVELQDDKLASLHGDSELNEARIQTLVSKYYPEKIWPWMAWRAKHPTAPWSDGADALGILSARITQSLAAGQADELLKEDFKLSERRRIRATPSLVISNRPYDGDIDRAHLLGALCSSLDAPKPDACKDAPACFLDAQCRKRGYIAKCENPGTPQARCNNDTPAPKIPITVIHDASALASNHERIMEALITDLPGAEFTLLEISTPAGKTLAENAKLTRLPAYLLDITAKDQPGFQKSLKPIAREISAADQKFMLLREDRNGVGSNRFLARERIKGRADLFVSRFSKNGQEALESALDCAGSPEATGLNLVLHDIVYWKSSGELGAPNGLAELEEAARGVAVRLTAPDKLNAYLRERGKKRGSSYWDSAMKDVGIDALAIRALCENPTRDVLSALEADATLMKILDTGGDIVLLAENCELVPLLSRKDLKQILERIASRKP